MELATNLIFSPISKRFMRQGIYTPFVPKSVHSCFKCDKFIRNFPCRFHYRSSQFGKMPGFYDNYVKLIQFVSALIKYLQLICESITAHDGLKA